MPTRPILPSLVPTGPLGRRPDEIELTAAAMLEEVGADLAGRGVASAWPSCTPRYAACWTGPGSSPPSAPQ